MTLQKKTAPTTAAMAPVCALTIALIALAFWFLRTPTQPHEPQFSQEQLHALAAQAAQVGQQSGQTGHHGDPYKEKAIKNTIRQHALDLQQPWLAYLATQPTQTEGAITLSWLITPDGKTAEVAVVHSDFDQGAFNEGVRGALAAVVFPPPPLTQTKGQSYPITHRLYFKLEAEDTAAAAPAKLTAN